MKKLIIQPGANGQNSHAIQGSDYVFHYYGPTSAKTVTVPTGAYYALFNSNADFYVRWDGGTAVVPSSDVVNGQGSEINPTVRSVTPGQSFSLISASATDIVSIVWYK